MRRAALDVLACPDCHCEPTFRGEPYDGRLEEGALLCAACEREYPVREGIPHFIRMEELEGPNRRFARFYDRFSAFYAPAIRLAFLFMGGERKARMEILGRLDPGAGSILEVSIGPGINLPFLYEMPNVREVHGLDISLGQLRRCRSFAQERHLPVDLFLGTAESLPYKDSAFDCVFHIGGINFFNDKRQAIEEMIRVARPGTKVVIADETERVASLYDRMPGFLRPHDVRKAPAVAPMEWVPPAMEDIRMSGIWRAHGHDHGYCLTFRTPTRPG